MPTDIDIISDQLQILMDYHQLTEKQHDQILDKLKKEPETFKQYIDSLSKGLPAVTKGVIGAIKASKSGDPYAISIAAVDIFGGVATIAGPLLGPAGPLLSSLASMVSTILGEFLPKQPSLKEQLTELLNKFVAEEKLRDLGTALDQIWVLTDTIEHQELNYKPLNLQHGPEIRAIDDAWQWLKQKDKQALPDWEEVLEKTCMVWIQLMRCVALCIANPSTRAGVAREDVIVYLPSRQRIFLNHLKSIRPVARERGTYIAVSPWQSFGDVLYIANGEPGELKFQYKKNTAWLNNFSVSFPISGAQAQPPVYDVFTMGEGQVYHHRLKSVGGELSDGNPVLRRGRTYKNTTGNDGRLFDDCVSAWALPDWDDQGLQNGGTRVYTAHSTEIHNYVNVHQVDADDEARRLNWEPSTLANLRHIRAVARDMSDSWPDDADAVGLESRHYEIIYCGYADNPKFWMMLDNGWTDIVSPLQRYSGIEVDPYFLWVFGAEGLACATHASLVRCKKGQIGQPKWITFKPRLQGGFDVRSLSTSPDGILVIGSHQVPRNEIVMYSGDYSVDLKSLKMTWKNVGGARGYQCKQIKKMAIPCWSLFDRVMADLERQVGRHG